MTESDSWREGMDFKVAQQVGGIVDAFRAQRNIEIGVEAREGLGFMYARGHILVRDEYLSQVQERLGQPVGITEQVRRIVEGVVRLDLLDREDGPVEITFAVDDITRQFGYSVASPDYVLTVAGVVGPCPATEPEEVYDDIEPFPAVCPGNGGAGVSIYVTDTGLLDGAQTNHPWLAGVTGDPDPLPALAADGTQPIPQYTGHGTFVAGVIKCMAPAAEVFVLNEFVVAGSTLESDLVSDLDAALDRGVDIFNLSITAPTMELQPLLGFQAWLKRLRLYKGVICVVAAGNNGSRALSWPAAFPEVVSVGALAADWRSRASFTNYGGWVDVYAPGRGIINAYATGTYTCQDDPYTSQIRHFYGMARWSGTSFSTPIVTGLIAARMSRTGENGQEAAAALLRIARSQAIPGVGAILLPCPDDDGASHLGECCCAQRHRHRPCRSVSRD
jgi:subtilisin family serine protease